MIVYKKAWLSIGYFSGFVIVRMLVNARQVIRPHDTRKLRALRAKVLSITDIDDHHSHHDQCQSRRYSHQAVPLEYVVGKYAVANGLDRDRNNDCGQGIHFFRTRKEAVEY